METDDLLAHEVIVGGPELAVIVVLFVLIAQSGDVVVQGIDPHIDHMAGVKVHGHAPGEAGTGNTQVLQTGLDKVVDHFIDAALRLQEVSLGQQVADRLGILGELKEVGLFLGIDHIAAAVGALAVFQLALGPEGFTGSAVLQELFRRP